MRIVRIKVDMKVRWQGFYDEECQKWVGVCDDLALTIQANTWSELLAMSGEVADGLMRDLLASGELEEFLRERGWQAIGPLPKRVTPGIKFDVPIPVMPMARMPQRAQAAALYQ